MIRWYLFQAGLICALIFINLSVAVAIKEIGLHFVENRKPIGLTVNIYISVFIIFFITWGLFYFKYIQKYPTASILIVAGSWSNFLEKNIFGYVADYINTYIAYINLADIQIITGLILLNIQVWLLSRNSPLEDKNKE